MAMYYYASKLNEASCSGCPIKVPQAPSEPAPLPPPPENHAPIPPNSNILNGSGLSFYDNDDYYSMVRGNTCKQIVMNGGINFVATSSKLDASQMPLIAGMKSLTLSYQDSLPDKVDVEYKDGQIVSASIDTLVDMLRPGASKTYIFTFLLCSRLFIKPHELLNRLCKRYFKNYEKLGKNEIRETRDKELSDMISLVRLLGSWTSLFPYDFRDDRVMALVRSITQRCAADHMDSIRGEFSVILEKLLEKLTALEQYEETLVDPPRVSTVDMLTQGDILTIGMTPMELASQLTIVELHKLSFIGPEEFVQTFTPQSTQTNSTHIENRTVISIHYSEGKTTKNLEAYAEWFNRLSYLVATDILKAPKSKYRARVIEQWVMTARECFNIGNFNSLMSIVSALNLSSISRLKKTWSKTSTVCGQQLRQLELCIEPSGNHARYRTALAAAPTESMVPLLSVTCRDLHFANQGAPTKLVGNRINYEKCSLLARHVNAHLASRRLSSDQLPAPPRPAPYPPVWRYLNDTPTLNEQALELVSFDREPPADHSEKERLKRLRSNT